TFVSRLPHLSAPSAASQTLVLNGAARWNNDSKTTAPTFDFSSSGISTQDIAISALFADYSSSHQAASNLGKAVTVAFSTHQGWVQFFQFGALLLLSPQSEHLKGASDPLASLLAFGVKDAATGTVRLPLLQTLLTVGSEVPVGGDGSSFTYADLRKATAPALLVPAPATSQVGFIKGGMRAGKAVGHVIPRSLWNYITRTDISPDGWQMDFGSPLTEALAFSLSKDGHVHHMLVQGFWRDAVILDQDSVDAAGQPLIERLETGVAYLRTVGPPAVSVQKQQTIWTQSDTALLDTAGTGLAVAHLEEHFPLTLLGETTRQMGMRWSHVQWIVPRQLVSGWVSAAAATLS